MFTVSQLKTMFTMQAELNAVMGSPTWLTDGNNYLRAARIELFESIDHYGYKWWKKQNPNIPQVQLELVDAWHFMMSDILVKLHEDPIYSFDALIDDIAQNINSDQAKISYFNGDFNTCVEQAISIMLISNVTPLPSLLEACDIVGLTGDQFFKMYVSKNTLNLFRQKHGDKQGTYIKQWFGQEDNVFLASQIDSLDLSAPDFIDQLNASLEAQYAAVKAAVTH